MATITEALPEIDALDQIRALESQYLLQNYARYPLALHHGRGCYVYDLSGKRYLDLLTGIGVNSLGHSHPRLVKAIRQQSALLLHTSNLYYHEYQGRLAERLSKVSGLQRTFFCNSGAESMEGALKMIRAHGRKIDPEKYEIIALHNSFHGRTLGALSITGQEKYRRDFEPLLAGAKFVPANDIVALEQVFCEKTSGIVMEWIQGEGGINPMTTEYARKARELADRYDALLVFDEIQCGVGRPGTYFSYQLTEPWIMPDVMVAAKPLACGIPLGFIAANERAAVAIGPGMHGSTFGGGPLACAALEATVDVIRDERLLENVRENSEYLLAELKKMVKLVEEARGLGYLIGIKFPSGTAKSVQHSLLEKKIITGLSDDPDVLRLLPPLTLRRQEIDLFLDELSKVE